MSPFRDLLREVEHDQTFGTSHLGVHEAGILKIERYAIVQQQRLAHLGSVDDRAQSLSPSPNRRCAVRARSSAADAPYRSTIARLFQPYKRIRSLSLPPALSQWCAPV